MGPHVGLVDGFVLQPHDIRSVLYRFAHFVLEVFFHAISSNHIDAEIAMPLVVVLVRPEEFERRRGNPRVITLQRLSLLPHSLRPLSLEYQTRPNRHAPVTLLHELHIHLQGRANAREGLIAQ